MTPGLRRTIGVSGLAATVLNVIVGSSIYVFPAIVGAALGAAGILAYLIAAVAMGLIVLCLIESGGRVTGAGGAYAYVDAALGPFAAWVVGLLMYAGVQVIASAVVASVFVGSLSLVMPIVGTGAPRGLLLVAIYVVFATINIRGGATLGARVVTGVTAAKLVPLLVLIGLGLVASRPENLAWEATPALGELGRMAMRLLFLFGGVEAALAISGELKDPSRTIPRAVLIGLGLATALYLGVQFAAQGLLGDSLGSHTQAPLADAATVALGGPGRNLMLLGAAIAPLGFLSADMLISPRTLFAMGQGGRLPRVLASVQPRFGSPAVAIAVHAVIACGLAISADFDTLTALASSALLVIYFLCCVATLVLQRRRIGEDSVRMRLPFGPLVPLAATALVVAMMTTLALREVVAVALVIGLAGVTYLLSRPVTS